MCGRYVYTADEELETRYSASYIDERVRERAKQSSFNVAPSQMMPVIWQDETGNKISLKRWGLIPFWSKDPKIGYKMINARSETVDVKPAFRSPFKSRRCLVPVNGYYEWQQIDPKTKQPVFIHRKDSKSFALAGLHEHWTDENDNKIESFAILTTEPNDSLSKIHDRMPVILNLDQEMLWIDGATDIETLKSLLKPYGEENDLEAYPVAISVNSPRNNSGELIKHL